MKNVANTDEVRSLTNLRTTASTARVLNLTAIFDEFGQTTAYKAQPFFTISMLNRAIFIKHKLRSDEQTMFENSRTSATKILLPIDGDDLGIGAQSFFVGQIGFAGLLGQSLGMSGLSHSDDMNVLKAMDDLPSLDPFLLRERLKAVNRKPAACYFNLAQADVNGVVSFAVAEVAPLAEMMCATKELMVKYSAKLARKIILNENGLEFEPLRQAMQLDRRAFDEGMFCWKAFIYYKWRLSLLEPQLAGLARDVARRVSRLRPGHPMRPTLLEMGRRIGGALSQCHKAAMTVLDIYETAYQSMTQTGKTKDFRDFLVKAPDYFNALGHRVAGLDHSVSYWTYRFGSDFAAAPSAEEIADILADFLEILTSLPPGPALAA